MNTNTGGTVALTGGSSITIAPSGGGVTLTVHQGGQAQAHVRLSYAEAETVSVSLHELVTHGYVPTHGEGFPVGSVRDATSESSSSASANVQRGEP
jgi:hypothetical protein